MALFNILVQWYGLPVGEDGFVCQSLSLVSKRVSEKPSLCKRRMFFQRRLDPFLTAPDILTSTKGY